ncbi:MAG: lysophospholipid acyltransferase family protein [Anaerolineae bacterium]
MRANLRQILGPEADDARLHRMTRQVFFHAGQTYYDFFHAIGQPKEVIAEAVRIPDEIVAFVRSETARGRGVLMLATHMSNFDLLGLSMGTRDLPIQMLSLADPQAGFHLLNYLRAKAGFEVTPITPQSLRAAIRRLKSGGIVLTGVDRPILRQAQDTVPADRELGLSSRRRIETLVEFFGRPAYLPVGPVRLALMTGALVIMASCYYEPDKGYALEVTEPLEMIRTGDRRRDILTNVRWLADILEQHVRARPEQWMMFHHFWPELPAA